MRRYLVLLLLLAACTPTLSGDRAVFALSYSEGVLRADAAAPFHYLRARVRGVVTSPYCEVSGCVPEADGFVYIGLPPHETLYPPNAALATGRVERAEAVALLQGERESRRAALRP